MKTYQESWSSFKKYAARTFHAKFSAMKIIGLGRNYRLQEQCDLALIDRSVYGILDQTFSDFRSATSSEKP